MFSSFDIPKRILTSLGLFLLSFSFLYAESVTDDLNASFFNQLLDKREPNSFLPLLKQAKEQKVSEQTLIEAEMLYHIDREDDQALVSLLPRMVKNRKSGKLEHSNIFSSKNDRDAAISFIKAVSSFLERDDANFEKHIKEAYWLNPAQAPILQSYIETFRTNKLMQSIIIDFSHSLPSFTDQSQLTLQSLLNNKQGLLLHFWSHWSPDAESTLPEFQQLAQELKQKNIATCSLLPEDAIEDRNTVLALLKDTKSIETTPWFIDQDSKLSRLFQIRRIPTILLISRQGRILFHGTPSDSNLNTAITKLISDRKE